MSSRDDRTDRLPLLARVLLVDVAAVSRALERLAQSRAYPAVPNTWQITLGILRMWHRMAFRSGTVGTSRRPVRDTWRARLLVPRPVRFPFLLAERAIAPLDFSGLLSARERVIRHLLGAHHDENQFAYDLEMLQHDPGALEELAERVRAVTSGRDPRAAYLRDLTVFEGYHEDLELAVTRALQGDFGLTPADARDPDISFAAYLAWCARQPATPADTWRALRAGRFGLAEGLA
ncbi:MAG: hypothetical protein JNL21_10000 [Myxococcales bacterium]|nr:hypothetical protein [Myxococcales bacterium]